MKTWSAARSIPVTDLPAGRSHRHSGGIRLKNYPYREGESGRGCTHTIRYQGYDTFLTTELSDQGEAGEGTERTCTVQVSP